MSSPELSRRRAWAAFGLYLAFVVYGSLVPFEYRHHTVGQAFQAFSSIVYLDLGVTSRADWIANIVLYVPLAFLGCMCLIGMDDPRRAPHLGVGLVLAACLATAVGVEFAQIFVAPRTVSLNDLLAEGLGTVGGVTLWAVGRQRINQLADAFARGGRPSVLAALAAYAALYAALALFPYDFVLSARELSAKFAAGSVSLFVARGGGGWLRCGARLTGDALAVAPLGVLIALAWPRVRAARLFVLGVGLGLALEGLQLLLASGTSQGASALLRGAGLAGGAAIGHLLRRNGPVLAAWFLCRAAPFAALPYAAALAGVAGLSSRRWLPPGEALGRLAEVRFLPFYYHYFSTEAAAMASLLAQAAMYAPVGVVTWAFRVSGAKEPRRGAWVAALGAAFLALPFELGKLLVPPRHPDPTDLIIAAASAAFTYALADWIGRTLDGGCPAEPTPPRPVAPPPAEPGTHRPTPHPIGVLVGLLALAACVLGLAKYPMGAPVAAFGLLTYGVLLWRWPDLWLFAVPALLPTLDLSAYTGRLLLDEVDLVVLVTLGVVYLRRYRSPPAPWPNALFPAAVAALWVTWGVATARGLWPLLGAPDGLAPSSHSPLEAWLVGKGLLWALLLVPLLRRIPREARESASRQVINGLVAGLGVVTLVVLGERHVFVGLRDFENVFRVTGTFSSMNSGGAYIEAFLAFAFPALAAWTLTQRHGALRLLGLAAGTLTSYAMFVTFSRGGYAGLLAGLLVVALGAKPALGARRWALLAALTVAAVAVALPVLSGGFAQRRLSRAAEDLAVRQVHWRHALDLMDDGPVPALTGMGFGRYPARFLTDTGGRVPPGTYRVQRDGDNPYLRLGPGEPVYLDQRVDVEPGASYALSARVRQPLGEAPLTVALCEKALLYSFDCVWQPLAPGPAGAGWKRVTVPLDLGGLGTGGNWPHRPVKLSLHNGSGNPVDVDDVSLRKNRRRELVANGDFSDGAARWLFVTDQDLAWHIHEMWIETYFAQGLLGVAAVTLLLVGTGAVLWPAVRKGDLQATALAGALAGFLTVGLLGSTLDTARLSMLFYLGALWAPTMSANRRPTDH